MAVGRGDGMTGQGSWLGHMGSGRANLTGFPMLEPVERVTPELLPL